MMKKDTGTLGQYQISAFVMRDTFCPRLELYWDSAHQMAVIEKYNSRAVSPVQDINMEEI